MQTKKEKFLNKIVKRNYNNELELILETKNFDENAKNILLSILYKLEIAYKDYEQVKRNIMPKDEFLNMIVNTIRDNVEVLQIVKMNSPEAEILGRRNFLVEKKNKKIIAYPIERKLLYALSQVTKKDKVVKEKYFPIDKTISDLLNIGHCINIVEPLRDFNGFSWTTVTKEIESLDHNLIYQNLRIIAGAKFLNYWLNNWDNNADYFELFQNKLEMEYGKNIKDALIDNISKLSVLLEIKYDKNARIKLEKNKVELENRLEEIQDKEFFIIELTKDKKILTKKIKDIDKILNDRILLQLEYKKRNDCLPLDKKIFSIKTLADILKNERKLLISRLEKQNTLLNPQKFVKYEKNLEEKYKYLKLLEIDNVNKEIEKQMIELQQLFLECYGIKVQTARTREEITDLIIELRYYMNLPFSSKKNIGQVIFLEKQLNDVMELLINKAIQNRVLVKMSNNDAVNYEIFKNIFNTRIIKLDGINIKLLDDGNILILQIYDETIFDKNIELLNVNKVNINDLIVRLNKNIKIFYI